MYCILVEDELSAYDTEAADSRMHELTSVADCGATKRLDELLDVVIPARIA